MQLRTLILIPTYNEHENAVRILDEISKLSLDADLMFIDDNSPDGTGDILEAQKSHYSRLIVHHRSGRLGVGSAHYEGIQWAYEQGYQQLVTMDCDFSHTPSDIPILLEAVKSCDISVGSRWINADGLPGWSMYRRCLTWLGHFLTKGVLGIPQDASGAFRVYRLDRIPSELFSLVKSRGYAFFFESLFIINRNGFSVSEVPIKLPARTYGHSKMSKSLALQSGCYIFELWVANLRKPEQFLMANKLPDINQEIIDDQDWDNYWNEQEDTSGIVYELIAGIYRRAIIKRNLNRVIKDTFTEKASLLHAGCGSGQVDDDLQHNMNVTALDISPAALRRYCQNVPKAASIMHGSIFDMPFCDDEFDGIYNLGVVEHFTSDELVTIFQEFHRVLQPGGKVVIFWPHKRATSVFVLKICHIVMRFFSKNAKQLHPPEVSLLPSKEFAHEFITDSGFNMIDYQFGPSDFFVQAIIVAEKPSV